MNRRLIQVLTYCGILIAMSVVLSRFASIRLSIGGVENIRVGLGPFPILLTGVLFGPFFGAIVGILADIVGYAISSIGAYMPHFTLVSAMYGLIPGVFMQLSLVKSLTPLASFRLRFIMGVVFSQLITQWLLLPWFLYLTFQLPWQVSLIPRYITAPIQIIAYIIFGIYLFSQPYLSKFVKDINSHNVTKVKEIWTFRIIGAVLGIFTGYIVSPLIPIIGERLPFMDVITGGIFLIDLDKQIFSELIVKYSNNIFIGLAIGFFCGYLLDNIFKNLKGQG